MPRLDKTRNINTYVRSLVKYIQNRFIKRWLIMGVYVHNRLPVCHSRQDDKTYAIKPLKEFNKIN